MENLNAEQIKKALECCTRGRKSKEDIPCLECPYNECNLVGGTSERQIKGTCQGWLMKDALALIKSQEQMIEELEFENGQYYYQQRKLVDEKKKLTEENERLMREKTALECVVSTARNQAKAETVRRMQESLKDCFDNEIEHKSIYTESQVLFVIDQIANELLNGEGMCNEK